MQNRFRTFPRHPRGVWRLYRVGVRRSFHPDDPIMVDSRFAIGSILVTLTGAVLVVRAIANGPHPSALVIPVGVLVWGLLSALVIAYEAHDGDDQPPAE